jgi:hypothetical protein
VAFDYVYHGAGVGVGDFDGDRPPRPVLRRQHDVEPAVPEPRRLRFADVTGAAGLATDAWVNGVAVADVNGDGRTDLYLCVGGPPAPAAATGCT